MSRNEGCAGMSGDDLDDGKDVLVLEENNVHALSLSLSLSSYSSSAFKFCSIVAAILLSILALR